MTKQKPKTDPRPTRLLTDRELARAGGGVDYKNNASTAFTDSWTAQK